MTGTGGLGYETALALTQAVKKISLYASRPADFGHIYEIVSEAELRGAVAPL